MIKKKNPVILSVDDDTVVLNVIDRMLSGKGYDIFTADSGTEAFRFLAEKKPDLILVDIRMPEMNGFEFCSRLQENKDYAYIPVIFVTALKGEQDKAQAFSYGAVGYVVKPFEEEDLVGKIKSHLETKTRWSHVGEKELSREKRLKDFFRFKKFLFNQLSVHEAVQAKYVRLPSNRLYALSKDLRIQNRDIALSLSQFLGLDYLPKVNPNTIQLGVLPTSFSIRNSVVAVRDHQAQDVFILSNPFNGALLDELDTFTRARKSAFKFIITEPENIANLLQ